MWFDYSVCRCHCLQFSQIGKRQGGSRKPRKKDQLTSDIFLPTSFRIQRLFEIVMNQFNIPFLFRQSEVCSLPIWRWVVNSNNLIRSVAAWRHRYHGIDIENEWRINRNFSFWGSQRMDFIRLPEIIKWRRGNVIPFEPQAWKLGQSPTTSLRIAALRQHNDQHDNLETTTKWSVRNTIPSMLERVNRWLFM